MKAVFRTICVILFVVVVMVQARKSKTSRTPSNDWFGAGCEIVDLTHPFDGQTLGYPGLKLFELEVTHQGVTDAGYWLQTEDYSSAIHVGTHMDAPCHIVERQWTLEQIPLHRFMAPAAVVDISRRASRDRNTDLMVQDLTRWESKNNRTLDGTIVLVNSGWTKKWLNKKDFLGTATEDVTKLHFPGVSPEAAEWLATNRKIYGLGVDTTSLDNGQAVHRKAHQALFRANIFGLENVANLHKLPEYGAFLFVFPMRIREACGAPTRVIAMVPKELEH